MLFPCRILEILLCLICNLASKYFSFLLQGDDQGVGDHEVCLHFLYIANCNFCCDKKATRGKYLLDGNREENRVTFQIPFH